MSADQYFFSYDKLVISDSELGLEITFPSLMPRLPLQWENGGVMQEMDKEGNLISAYLVLDGRRHGECRLFAENRRLRGEMFYLHGKLHGPSIMYAENGNMVSKTWYCEGKKNGKAQFYFATGELQSVQRFKNGEWEGVQEYFYCNGSPKSNISFCAGKLQGDVNLFWESKNPKRSVRYVENLREGSDKLWNEQGILIDEGDYHKGQPIGIHRHYFMDGKIQEELHYHAPSRFDRREWDSYGGLLFEGVFASDLSYTEKKFLDPNKPSVRKGVWDGNRLRWE